MHEVNDSRHHDTSAWKVISQGGPNGVRACSVVGSSSKVVGSKGSNKFRIPHQVAIELLEVHVGVGFQQEDRPEFVYSVVSLLFEELDINSKLPSVISKSSGITQASAGSIKSRKFWVHGVGFPHSKVGTRDARRCSFFRSVPGLCVVLCCDVLGDRRISRDIGGASHLVDEL